jgi:16S rRNA (uracil1498-N3)-methyltransferase
MEGECLSVAGEEAAHLTRVLRLGRGASCSLFDGSGRIAEARVESAKHEEVVVRLLSLRVQPPPPGPELVFLVGNLKADKLEWVAQKLTELGVDLIVPVTTERSVPRPEPKSAARRHERLQRIAREAARQSGRAHLPRLEPMTTLEEALGDHSSPEDLRAFCWEEAPQERRLGALLERAAEAPRLRILVGPEGGLSFDEANLAERRGFVPASLGPLILRAETAAIAACTLAAHRIGRLG